MRGLILASPSSGSGKTTLTLGLLRVFADDKVLILPAKSGPDYIDPIFHKVACGTSSLNLDAWAMSKEIIYELLSQRQRKAQGKKNHFLLIEGAMGVLDGAGEEGKGSVADLAELLNIPIVLIINASKQSQSVLLPLLGFRLARPKVKLAGVILNGIGSEKHLKGAKYLLKQHDFELLGWLPKSKEFAIAERHLGLVIPSDNQDVHRLLCRVANQIKQTIDIDKVISKFTEMNIEYSENSSCNPLPLGQNISVACDRAFCFLYPHLLDCWQNSGASIHLFSPLKNEGPKENADAVFLPGGYPELYLPTIANADIFKKAMYRAKANGALTYGECGGFMVLGRTLVDQKGTQYPMLGLLPHNTSIQSPKLTLGYRILQGMKNTPFEGSTFMGHEFHYSRTVESEIQSQPLFKVWDSSWLQQSDSGSVSQNVFGSYSHIICQRGKDLG